MITSIELRALAQSLSAASQALEPCSDWDVISLRDIAARLRNLATYMEELADDKAAEQVRALFGHEYRGIGRHWYWRNISDGSIEPQAFASRQQATAAMDPHDPNRWRLVSCGRTICFLLPVVRTGSRP